MAEQGYDLMHKDDVVASLQLDDLSGAILKVTPGTNPELLPLGGSQGADSLRKWWLRRAVPISQGNIAALLQQEGIPSTQSLLVRNLGLSLSDHYWIKPNGSELTWKDVSLFSNSFRDPLESMQIQHPHGAASTSTQTPAYSPSASLQGDLIKKWLIVDDTRCLLKGNRGANSQQNLNEVLAELEEAARPFATIEEWFRHIEEYTRLLRLKSMKRQEDREGVRLMTLHSAKGLEFDTVFLVEANEGKMPYKKAKTDAETEEERRLFYVGMTRAKEVLKVSYVKTKNGKETSPSRFVDELLE